MADFPTTIWDGEQLSVDGLAVKDHEDFIEPHLLRSLAIDLTTLTNELIATQNHFIDKWDDLRITVNSVKVSTTNPPTWTSYKGSEILAFSDQAVEGNEEIVYFICQMPHNWKEASTIIPHAHWVGEDNTAGNVRWLFTYSWANVGSAFPSETSLTVDDANGDTDIHNIASFGNVSGTSKNISSILLCSLKRNSSHANDTFTSKDAYLLEIDIHYQCDGVGSDNETSK
jgi:hypothetical protein